MVVDITNKLNFDEKIYLKIKTKQYEVKTDAKTMVLIMGKTKEIQNLSEEEQGFKILEFAGLLFGEEGKEELLNSGISFTDFIVAIECAMEAVQDTPEQKTGE